MGILSLGSLPQVSTGYTVVSYGPLSYNKRQNFDTHGPLAFNLRRSNPTWWIQIYFWQLLENIENPLIFPRNVNLGGSLSLFISSNRWKAHLTQSLLLILKVMEGKQCCLILSLFKDDSIAALQQIILKVHVIILPLLGNKNKRKENWISWLAHR